MLRCSGINVGVAVIISIFLVINSHAAITSYTTAGGQIRIIHNTTDEGLYYNCDTNEIAQNVQIIRTDVNTYHTVYHSEPKKTVGMN